ncbi:MAG: hypothetical protein ABIG69_16340 [Bacteroidota bacterium]|nr:hypothetical protein [Bacteroidota bacterium]
MSIKEIITLSFRDTVHNRKYVLLLWSTNALLAFIISLPLYTIFTDNLAHSLLSAELAVRFDYFWYIQFRHLYRLSVEHYPAILYSVVAVYAFIQTFYLGGLISVFNNINKNHMSDFFYSGVKYWYRFTKVLFISAAFFATAFIVNDLIGDLITLIFVNMDNIIADFVIRSLRYVFLIFIIGLITIISDYTKVYLAIEDKLKVRNGIIIAVKFFIRNFRLVFIVFLIVSILGAIGAIIYNIVENFVPRTPHYFLALSFILQQMLIIFRLAIRMVFCSTEVNIYKDLSAQIADAEIKIQKKEK